MSTPSANKRRRVDAANAVLRKPFHSPVIRRPGTAQDSPTGTGGSQMADRKHASTGETLYSPSSPSTTPAKEQPAIRPVKSLNALRQPARSLSTSALKSAFKTPVQGNGAPKRKRVPSPAAEEGPGSDILALIKAHRNSSGTAHTALLKDLDRQIETARQARRIEAASGPAPAAVDEELRELVMKWKYASRAAAEELFESVKERVENAGGTKAWTAMRKRQTMGWVEEEEKEARKKKTSEDGNETYEGHEGQEYERVEEEDEGDVEEESDPEFNMAQMLRSLNIDLDLLGYDEAEEKWID